MKNSYEITDVDESNKQTFCVCLEDWSDEMKEAGSHKACWYEKMKDKGLGVKLVKDIDGELAGMIQYIPADYAPLTGDGFYFIYCIWVHGHKKGIGDRRGHGMGTALLEAAEADIRARGAKGAAAWGVSLPFWMKASWYRKHGYRVVQKDGGRRLLWKPLKEGAEPPQWYAGSRKPELSDLTEAPVQVTSVINGICPAMNLINERAKAVCSEFDGRVLFKEVKTDTPESIKEWGFGDSLFINHRKIELGPPLPSKKIRKMIRRELKKNR